MHYFLSCTSCGKKLPEDCSEFRCSKCKGILEVNYDYNKIGELSKTSAINNERYSFLFPIHQRLFSLNEGGTQLVENTIFGIKIKLKLETQNPTRSFKDRGSAVEITKAIEFGFDGVCCASTGNMGLSIATYAKIAGKKCTIFISKDAYPDKIGRIKEAGAEVVEVDGDFNDALDAAEKFAVKNGSFLCGDYHFRKEGQKSVMFEILEQSQYSVPDFLFVPVGNATLLSAVYKALLEFRRLSLIKTFPRIVAVQASGCSPLIDAYNKNKEIERIRPKTIADAIAVGYPTFGFEGLESLRATDGVAIAVDDEEIINARRILNENGISSEPGGASAFAGFIKLKNKNKNYFHKKSCVVIVSGDNEKI